MIAVNHKINAFRNNGVEITPSEGQIEIEGPLNEDAITFFRDNKTEVLNHLYGLNDIRRGVWVADIYGVRGHTFNVYPHRNQVGYNSTNSVHPIYRKVWDLTPIIKLSKINRTIRIPHDRKEWSGLLISGLRAIKGLPKPIDQGKQRPVHDYESALHCDWRQLSTWKFAQYLENYFGSLLSEVHANA